MCAASVRLWFNMYVRIRSREDIASANEMTKDEPGKCPVQRSVKVDSIQMMRTETAWMKYLLSYSHQY